MSKHTGVYGHKYEIEEFGQKNTVAIQQDTAKSSQKVYVPLSELKEVLQRHQAMKNIEELQKVQKHKGSNGNKS